MKSLILAFILGLSVSGFAFAEGETSLEDCGAYAESSTRESTKQSSDQSKTEEVKSSTSKAK